MRPTAGRLTATLLASALLLAACSSPDAGGGPTPSATPEVGTPTTEGTATPTPGAHTSPATEPTPSPRPSPRAAAPDPATVPDGPRALAAELVAAETAVRDPDVTGDELVAWARVQQARYRQLADRADWHEPVLAAVPDARQDVVRLNLEATVELRRLTAPRESLPPWRIVPPPAPEELLAAYRAAADEFGVDWTFLAAIHLVESRMGRIRGDSTAGARGPMQFLPSTWEAYGEGDIEDPHDAIRAAGRYLADHGAPGDMHAAIWAYNHSDRYVTAVQNHAAVMRADERAYLAYHAWQVYYRLASGDVVLEVGYDGT